MRLGLNRTRCWVAACCGFVSGSAHAQIPGIPTLAESGLAGFDVTSWFGIAAPAKTPRAIIEQLNGSIVRAVNMPDLRARLQDQGADPVGNTPEQYTAFIQNEIAKWAKVIKAAGIKGQ